MLYQAYEMMRAMVAPYRTYAILGKSLLKHPFNPMRENIFVSSTAAMYDVFESATRRYDKPEWNLENPEIEKGVFAKLKIKTVVSKPFCDLLHFRRSHKSLSDRKDPKILVVAPMSGHYATLLRGTVQDLIHTHDVYITDWRDARMVPALQGKFGLEDFISYIMDFIRHLGEDVHVLAVCQPGPPTLAAVALLSEDNDIVPKSMTFMGSPIDPRKSPTVPNELATTKPIEWFEKSVIETVPFPYSGMGRRVYPGFLQLTGFMSMNLDRHYKAQMALFQNLVKGDGDSVEKHHTFYDEYLAVMDLTAEFYLETIKTVFQDFSLPKGKMKWNGRTVDPKKITKTALMTIEGKKDDISGVGQTRAAHDLCTNIPEDKKLVYLHPTVGHYGVFNGSRWRQDILPEFAKFIRANG